MVTYWLKITYCILHCILHKNCLFFATFLLPLSHSAPSLPMFSEVNRQETSHGAILQWRPHDRSWSRFGMIPDCDRRSDGQTVRRTESIMAKTALCIASYADALSKTQCQVCTQRTGEHSIHGCTQYLLQSCSRINLVCAFSQLPMYMLPAIAYYRYS